MPTIDPDYRANINRSVCVFADLSDALVSQLAPQILKHRSSGDAPITVFINSLGGHIRCLEYLYGLLTVAGPTGKKPRIITVAAGNAASSAATLLGLGDYAIAYPKSEIYFHGVRYGKVEDVTMEYAGLMAAQLEKRNKIVAEALAVAGTKRLAFQYARQKENFQQIRTQLRQPQLSEIECFAQCLKQHLSESGRRIVDNAIHRWRSLSDLHKRVISKVIRSGKSGIKFEAEVLRRIIQYEVAKNKNSDWCLDEEGVFQIVTDYLLLRDYDMGGHVGLMRNILELYGYSFFETQELEKILDASKSESLEPAKPMILARVREVILPFCYFGASVWQRLQQDENPLSPEEAYWLGAVDEIYDSNLPCKRELAEGDDPQQLTLPASTAPAPPSGQSAPSV